MGHANPAAIRRDVAALVRPPERLTVPEAAERYVRTKVGAWSNALTYYMVEPASCLTMREFEGVAFAGPARTGKTQALMDNWLAHTVMCDPTNMLLVFPIASLAQRFSEERVDAMHRHSPEIRAHLSPDSNADNIFRKKYRSGMNANLVSPTKNTLAGLEYERVCLIDYDRFDEDIGGDGDAWKLGSKRTETFMSRGMTCAESSPSKPITDASWKATDKHPHEAPPSNGILGLFNRGDRRRLYVKCQHCGDYWMPPPGIEGFDVPDDGSIDSRSARAGVICAQCGAVNGPEHARAVRRSGVWVREGQEVCPDGRVHGEGRRARIASFWLPGAVAAFNPWPSLVSDYLTALETFERTKDEGALKSCINVDFGAPYLERSRMREGATVEQLMDRSEASEPRGIVPDGVRFLVAAVDVQASRFVVQVEGFGVNGESWIVDRYDLSVSDRKDDDGRSVAIAPATYIEDWQALERDVITRSWALGDYSGRTMRCTRVVCDMHGAPGVTERAYEFWRRCRSRGLGRTFRLLRGDRHADSRVRETTPDQVDRAGRKRTGDVPVLQLNVDRLKDMARASIERPDAGPGALHMPDWLDREWYEEALAERRNAKGRWEKEKGARNETLDLLGYARAAAISLGAEKIRWDAAPRWAAAWIENENVIGGKKKEPAAPAAAAMFGNQAPTDEWLR